MLIRVVDLETTGFPPDAEVVEIATVDVMAMTLSIPEVIWSDKLQSLVRAERPIPPAASAVHHIIDADIADAPPWHDAWPAFVGIHGIDVFAAHSCAFERAFITDAMTGGAHGSAPTSARCACGRTRRHTATRSCATG